MVRKQTTQLKKWMSWTGISPKQRYGWWRSTWGDAQHCIVREQHVNAPRPHCTCLEHRQHRTLARTWSNRNSHPCWWEYKMEQPNWRNVRQLLIKLNILLLDNPVTVLLAIYLAELTISPYKNLHTSVYSSFIYSCRNLEATEMCFVRWMNKLRYIQTMECYSGLKGNEL